MVRANESLIPKPVQIQDRGARARDGRFRLRIHEVDWTSNDRDRLAHLLAELDERTGRQGEAR